MKKVKALEIKVKTLLLTIDKLEKENEALKKEVDKAFDRGCELVSDLLSSLHEYEMDEMDELVKQSYQDGYDKGHDVGYSTAERVMTGQHALEIDELMEDYKELAEALDDSYTQGWNKGYRQAKEEAKVDALP